MDNTYKLLILMFLLIIVFTFGCKQTQNVPSVQPAPDEVKLTPSTVPPTDQEIVKLSNGYQVTSGLKLLIDQRCEATGMKGGDTGNGYGCVAA